MTMQNDPMGALADAVKPAWQRFLDVYEPLRPELYRYCRYLTKSPWDAEDLVQDTLARAFATLGCFFQAPPNPRAWMFRVASNLWIDRTRRRREVSALPVELAAEPEQRADREAAGTLIARLSPQERAAVVLKDVFDLTLEEVADALSTSVGTVKTALHRGRAKLTDNALPEPSAGGAASGADSSSPALSVPALSVPASSMPANSPSARVLDAFCDAFNARDLERLTALLLDTSVVELVGVVTEYGPDAARHPETGSFAGFLQPITSSDSGAGIDPRHLDGYLGQIPRVEVRQLRGEPILLYWYAHADGDAVRTVARLTNDGGRLATLRNYFFTPDVITEVCRELGVPFRTNGYRYWRTQP
jgi:RNA polymerase sigma-70 factor (ECF subfamily)